MTLASIIAAPGIERTTPLFRAALVRVAEVLGVNPDYLATVISFETGGTFSPAQKNRAGSHAVGLIQFMPDTATMLGTTSASLAAMSALDQLEYVRRFLARYRNLSTLEDLYLAVFYPAAIGKSLDTTLFTEGSTAYTQNKGFDTTGKGYITVGDVTAAIRSRYAAGLSRPRIAVDTAVLTRVVGGGALAVLVLGGAAAYFLLRRKP
jgi:hypothetical protein